MYIPELRDIGIFGNSRAEWGIKVPTIAEPSMLEFGHLGIMFRRDSGLLGFERAVSGCNKDVFR